MHWMLCGGDLHAKAWGGRRPFPNAPARLCRLRTLPCLRTAPAGATVAMSLNLNGSSFPVPFSAASQFHFRGNDVPCKPLGGVSRGKMREKKFFCIPRYAKIRGPAAAFRPRRPQEECALSGEPF